MHLTDRQRGLALGICAHMIWGLAALYWVQTEPVSAADLLAHRALWSMPVVLLVLLALGTLRDALAVLRQPRALLIMFCAALSSAGNWGVFLWAVTNEQATQASLGYFLLPLLNVFIGMAIFGERLVGAQKIAVSLAAVAVLVQVAYHGSFPWVAVGLATTFGLYGAIRKGVSIGSVEGFLIETLFMVPFALAWLIYAGGGGLGQHGLRVDAFLLGAGLMTAIPLITYVSSSRLMALTDLGLVFYIGPTVQLIVAVTYLGEPFDRVQLVAFSLVWIGLLIVTADTLRLYRKRKASPNINELEELP
ncbi:MAG: EamA family transporter RarD [Pseudomonadota bacterium]